MNKAKWIKGFIDGVRINNNNLASKSPFSERWYQEGVELSLADKDFTSNGYFHARLLKSKGIESLLDAIRADITAELEKNHEDQDQ